MDLLALAQEFEDLGYLSDTGYAQMRANGLASRGYGHRRIEQDLRANGIDDTVRGALLRISNAGEDDASSGTHLEPVDRKAAAITFARRKRIGPYAPSLTEPEIRRKQLAQMLRAGHDYDIARKLVDAAPNSDPETLV